MSRNPFRQFLQRIQLDRLQRNLQPYGGDDLVRSAMVFAPHQDDESLGCGGTVIRKKQAGAKVQVIYMTDGSGSNIHAISPDVMSEIREQEAVLANQTLGVSPEDVTFLRFRDAHLQEFTADAIAKVAEILQREQPEEIFIPYYLEPWIVPDHPVTNQIVKAAVKQANLSAIIYEYPIWFWYQFPWVPLNSEFVPRRGLSILKGWIKNGLRSLSTGLGFPKDFSCVVDISEVAELKRKALYQHASQMTHYIPDQPWYTIEDVADGEFLERLLQKQEVFYRYRSR
jgi:LmbE family N-acetylglucosaminyl deacetylase